MFTVNEKAIKTEDNVVIPGKKALLINEKCVNIVSNRYKVVQPTDVMETFQKMSGLTIDKVITNPNTGGLLLSSKLESTMLGGEEHAIDLTFYTCHNGSYKTFLSMQALRMACMNQLPALSSVQGLYLYATKHYNEVHMDDLKEIVETIPLHLSNFKAQYQGLHDIKFTKEAFLAEFVEHMKIQDEQKKDKVISKISDIYSFAKGQETLTNDSAYKAYQAVTYMNTHNVRKGKNVVETVNIKNQKDSFNWFETLSKAA